MILSINVSAINYSYEKPSHIWSGGLSEGMPYLSLEKLIRELEEIKDYSKISASDDERLYSLSSPKWPGGHPYTLYEFNIKYRGNITLIWEGYGVQPYMENITRYACLYLWNYSKSGWDLIINCTFDATENCSIDCTADKTLLFDLTTSSHYFRNGILYLLGIGPYGEGYSSGVLATDYIAIKHEATAEKSFPWIYLMIIMILILLIGLLYFFEMKKK